MNRGEVELLLAYCAAADPRFNTTDEMQASARVAVWQQQLADADPGWVNGWVARYYAAHHDWPLTVGAVRTAWGHEAARRESIARAEGLTRGVIRPPKSEESVRVIEATRATVQAAAAAGPPDRQPTKPLRIAAPEVFEGGAGHDA